MIWKRAILLVVLAITGLALQTTVLGSTTLLGAKPELLLLVTVALAMGEGPAFGAEAGFVLGLATDVLLQRPQGISALALTLIGYSVGRIRAQLQTPSAWLPMGMVFFATLGGVLFIGGFGALIGVASSGWMIARAALLASAYNALLTPFVFPIVRRLASRLRPTRVMP